MRFLRLLLLIIWGFLKYGKVAPILLKTTAPIVCLVVTHQLAFVMPGISPLMAISRSLPRPRPNLLYTPRGRPVNEQRLRNRTGLELRGNICSLILAE